MTAHINAGAAESSQRGRPVQLENLVKRYGSDTVVDGVDLDIRAGELLTLLGASGSGKTTLLSMIAGFTTPTSGRVTVADVDVTEMPAHRRNIGMVFQNYSLFPHMTVRVNVEFPLKQRGVSRADRRARALEALDVVELTHRADARPAELSGGQQQRVALARALVFSPSVLLMDEPFGALDRALRERMQTEVRRIHRDLGVTVVFVTHDQQEALTMSDRIAIVNAGRIEQVGTPEDLYERPETLYVSGFLGESNVLSGRCEGGVFRSDAGLVAPANGCADGPARLVVRPERVAVDSVAGGDLVTVSATVREVVYLGTDRRLVTATPDGEIVARVPTSTAEHRPGDEVVLGWRTQDGTVFPV